MNMNDKPGRIVGYDWQLKRGSHGVTAVWHAGYSPSGHKLRVGRKPWTVMGPDTYETFPTYAEAINWAFEQVPAKDPTPQERESVTAGWNATQDRLDAWKEKWELTR